ncbi:MAG: LysE family transporter [Polyangiaceae bacterium]
MIGNFALGVLLGFLGSIPAAGPLLLLVMEAGVSGRRARALSLASGGAVAEALFVGVAFAGAGELITRLPLGERPLRILGALFVIAIAAFLLRGDPARPERKSVTASAWLTGFLLVLLNPGFVAFWSGVAAFLYSHGALTQSGTRPAVLAIGAAFGIVLWFSLVFSLAARGRQRLSPRWLTRVRRGLAIALLLLGFGLALHAVVS